MKSSEMLLTNFIHSIYGPLFFLKGIAFKSTNKRRNKALFILIMVLIYIVLRMMNDFDDSD